ncbi:MAG: hypothetical protein LQ344_004981 [Seirophora lacunosa]|nr:MAG: hypothetical protein LQ344_004981 [Seirophora lacunosa]
MSEVAGSTVCWEALRVEDTNQPDVKDSCQHANVDNIAVKLETKSPLLNVPMNLTCVLKEEEEPFEYCWNSDESEAPILNARNVVEELRE